MSIPAERIAETIMMRHTKSQHFNGYRKVDVFEIYFLSFVLYVFGILTYLCVSSCCWLFCCGLGRNLRSTCFLLPHSPHHPSSSDFHFLLFFFIRPLYFSFFCLFIFLFFIYFILLSCLHVCLSIIFSSTVRLFCVCPA